ncbi:hypothetical protein UFOVP1575_12 [uncultured Caudovirales phage]|uniref:Uncharacterized protein n=1 Tax=uncultured Caudovirales phage TaxID=2100421 RepID=A0A6J5QQ39_9CAUD|nr:hypothetical protein UFOVP1128_31 [uncultured Caudovirales phage]CAB4192215.1 hypothetical protein UFOVP1237_15 [uncultured Caudovirales phage]CAB4216310.1 hypothetical protein UFOVP1489_5 [uncultured Caudovirales phage]CAB5230398.1 hypothetical protein UFOVP1575_12 [uncultured Caudovirales phage]
MINPSCCCTAIGCAGAVALKDAILAYDLTLLGCEISGTLAPQIAVTGSSIEYTQENFDQGCHNDECCITCGEPVFNCTNFCDPPFKKQIVECIAIHEKNRRYIPNGGYTSYCLNCQSQPAIDCGGCEGFPATSFTSSGFNSRSAVSIAASVSCESGLATNYVIATKVETIVTGDKTVVMYKSLSVGVSASSIPNLYPSCVMMTLRFRVTGAITGTCSDSVGQTVVYHSVWNGTDTAAQFMAKPMTLNGLVWSYDICPYNHGTDPYALYTCGGYDLASFKDTKCLAGCTSSGYSIDWVEQSYIAVNTDYECPPNTLYPIIDTEWQPWQDVPTTIQPLL